MDQLWEDLAPKALSSSGESVTRRKRTSQVLAAMKEKIGGDPPRKKQKAAVQRSSAIKASEELSAPAKQPRRAEPAEPRPTCERDLLDLPDVAPELPALPTDLPESFKVGVVLGPSQSSPGTVFHEVANAEIHPMIFRS